MNVVGAFEVLASLMCKLNSMVQRQATHDTSLHTRELCMPKLFFTGSTFRAEGHAGCSSAVPPAAVYFAQPT